VVKVKSKSVGAPVKKHLIGIAVGIAAASASPALAADLPVKVPVKVVTVDTTVNWSGGYIGLQGGGAWGRAKAAHGTGDPIFGFPNTDITNWFDISGGVFGIESGYNLQFGHLVIGYESDTSISTKRGSTAFIAPFNPLFTEGVRERWLSTWRARVGYAQDSWFLYGTGGVAYANVEQQEMSPVGLISEKNNHWGWAAGAGLEWMFMPKWSFKIEYLHVGLQEKSYFNPAPLPLTFLSDQRLRLSDDIVRVGVNYKFDLFALLTGPAPVVTKY
jgi:outer membrane immunogenic protein